jgi:hypothetical protein
MGRHQQYWNKLGGDLYDQLETAEVMPEAKRDLAYNDLNYIISNSLETDYSRERTFKELTRLDVK